MEREDDPNSRILCKQVCSSLVMLLVGLLFSFIMIMLAYFTYQTAVGSMVFCSFWTDIPGRLAIFISCYYMAGMCGYFPIPRRYRLHWFPEPFRLWSLESWRNLIRNLSCPSSYLINRLHTNPQDRRYSPELSHLGEECAERYYDCLPILRRRSAPVPIIHSDSHVTPVAVPPTGPPRNESPDTSKSADESFMSFDSPVGGYIVPMVKGKTSKSRYLSDTSSESSNNRVRAAEDERAGAVRNQQPEDHEQDIPSKQQGTGVQLPNHPRFPWCLLRHPKGIPRIARVLHKRNVRIEKSESEEYIRRQKREAKGAKFPTDKGAEGGLVTGIDNVDPTSNRLLLMERERIISEERTDAPTGAESALLIGNDDVDPRRNRLIRTGREMIVDTGLVELPAGRKAEGELVTRYTDAGPMTNRPLWSERDRILGSRRTDSRTKTAQSGLVMGNVPVDPIANRRRQLPSQRFSQRRRTPLRRQNKTTSEIVDKLHEFRTEIHKREDCNISHRKSQSEAGLSGMSESRQISNLTETKEETVKCSERLSNLQRNLDRLKRMLMSFERSPQTDTEASGMSESRQNIDIEAGRQIIETVDRNIGSSNFPASTTQTKTTDKPDTKISFTQDENSDSSPKDI